MTIHYTQCVCGHTEEEHRDGNRECEVEGCDCCCFEADLYEVDD